MTTPGLSIGFEIFMFGIGRLTLKSTRVSAAAACMVCRTVSLLVIATVPFGRTKDTRGPKRHLSLVTGASDGAATLTPGTVRTTPARCPAASTTIESSGSVWPQTSGSIVTRNGGGAFAAVVTTPTIVPPARGAAAGTAIATVTVAALAAIVTIAAPAVTAAAAPARETPIRDIRPIECPAPRDD